ncbi:5-oxoprolinase subunit C family protein [Pseudomonas xionganensis]|uniref:5-oxoprolinase/urea amidolyase family protein n=1 Tax=Pseudomonas xionganensis TaxID=2654845 RepID=A0A6I4L1U7_9PSED|nr:biotin-dependent carboxyltransferase family protein [Pseudomonas xionganensis]MVW76716.1 5-oxoprolinase/urea amidolyase family protein [Pseudomonas xionganensis]
MKGLRVLKPGPQSLLQDAGRYGWQHLGVSPSGVMDLQAAAWANRLLDNPWGTPLLEIALGDVQLEAERDTWVALCGADVPLSIDKQPMPLWTRLPLRRGQVLRLGFARSGQRLYLAVGGGFAGKAVLGSVSSQMREGLGGVDGAGRPLQAGDRLACRPASFLRRVSVPWPFQPDYQAKPLLRVITGGDAASFEEDQLQAFFAQVWQLSPHSDRMGARLEGEALQVPRRQWSLGVSRGAIQVPPDGQPIILQADHQTMGGYPLLGWLHPLDQGRLAQCPAHHPLRFTPVSVSDAQAEMREFYRFFGRG